MLTLKTQLTCSYCSRIVKNPILLPCDDSICGEHLSETNVVKENKIRCKECNKEFEVTCDEFRTIKSLNKLIESQSYLSGEERSLKQELEDKIRKFFQFYDAFVQTREKIDSVVFEYFQEMRNQIDEHREKLKEKIDEIALAMIERTKICEEEQLNSIKEKFFENSSFDETKSLLTELNQIEETFRNPNLLIETIKEMQRKQDESLRDIQSKFNEINQVKDNLKGFK
jgi:DNA-binding ferritin-like protein